jgi:hypothetical protein
MLVLPYIFYSIQGLVNIGGYTAPYPHTSFLETTPTILNLIKNEFQQLFFQTQNQYYMSSD